MSGVNKVIIVGRLGADPEVKTVTNNQQVAKLSIATSETWKDKNNQKQERTEWHRVIFWGKQAELAGKYLAKGRQVYIEGRLQTRSWEDNGQKKYATEIIGNVMEFLGDSGGQKAQDGNAAPSDFGPEPSFNTNEDIPF